MKYRGLPLPVRLVLWAGLALAIGGVLAATGSDAVASAERWLTAESGSLSWYVTRLFGWLAFGMLAGSVIYGLLLSTGILDVVAHRVVSFTLHQELAALGLALTAVHGAVLALDTAVPTSVAQILIPFSGAYRPAWVGIGQLAFLASAVVYASFFVRRRIGQRTWRLMHYLTFLAFVGATAHGLMSGSDSGATWALAAYTLTSAAVAFLFAYRIVAAVARAFSSSVVDRPSVGERT